LLVAFRYRHLPPLNRKGARPADHGAAACVRWTQGHAAPGSRPRTGGSDRPGEYDNMTHLSGRWHGGHCSCDQPGGRDWALSTWRGTAGEDQAARPGRAVPGGSDAQGPSRPEAGGQARTRRRPGTPTATGPGCRPDGAGRRRLLRGSRPAGPAGPGQAPAFRSDIAPGLSTPHSRSATPAGRTLPVPGALHEAPRLAGAADRLPLRCAERTLEWLFCTWVMTCATSGPLRLPSG
jgi:hypothetical protein